MTDIQWLMLLASIAESTPALITALRKIIDGHPDAQRISDILSTESQSAEVLQLINQTP